MKKIISFCLVICVILSFFSACRKENGNSDLKNDRYIYKLSHRKLKRYDLVKKTISVACPDPLCNHGSECLVNNIDAYTVTDKYIFLQRGWGGFDVDIYVYDIKNNKISFLTKGSQASQFYMVKEYAFFTLGEYVYDDGGDIEKQIFNVYRYNTNTNILEKVSNDDVDTFCNLILYKDGILYWDTRYSTDINFENKEELTKDEYNLISKNKNTINGVYFKVSFDIGPSDSLGRAYNLQIMDIENGESKVIVEYANSFRWTNLDSRNGLLYIPARYVWKNIDGEEKQILESENKIVYINTFDLSDTKTWEIPEGLTISTIAAFSGTCWYAGIYTSVEAQIYKYGDSGTTYVYDAMFVMNYETGESFVMVDDTSGMEVKAEETE